MDLRAELRDELVRVAVDGLAHAQANTMTYADRVLEVDASLYTDPDRFALEVRRIFRRLPLMLAASCELPNPGDYKTIEAAGIPVLLVRDRTGTARALLNICSHRAAIVAEGRGRAARFTCPYHAWTFDLCGNLIGIASRSDFGAIDTASHGLRPLPVLEQAGLIWVILDPDSGLDIPSYLSGYGELLGGFDFSSWHLIDTRKVPGPNWKLTFDAHLDWYHLPVLHAQSFGPNIGNKALYYYYGPHQRMFRPEPESPPAPEAVDLFKLSERPGSSWPTEGLMTGGWISFPNSSLYTIYNGGRVVNLNQIFPGNAVGESVTVQMLLSETQPDPEIREAGLRLCDFIERVVREEDIPLSHKQQRALETGLVRKMCFGRNEGGLQHFHEWIDRIVETDDPDLPALFPGFSGGEALSG